MTPDVAVSLIPLGIGYAVVIAFFVAFIRWVKRREAGESFAADFISECADVAAIEAKLPKFGEHP